MHGTNKTEKLKISPRDHRDAIDDDDDDDDDYYYYYYYYYYYNDDIEDDYDDVEKVEEGEGN